MKKHLTILLCSIALSGIHNNLTASEVEGNLRKEGLLMQVLESELAAINQSEQEIKQRINQLKIGTRKGQEVNTLDKKIAQERKKLSQLKRSRARLLLKQAYELKK